MPHNTCAELATDGALVRHVLFKYTQYPPSLPGNPLGMQRVLSALGGEAVKCIERRRMCVGQGHGRDTHLRPNRQPGAAARGKAAKSSLSCTVFGRWRLTEHIRRCETVMPVQGLFIRGRSL